MNNTDELLNKRRSQIDPSRRAGQRRRKLDAPRRSAEIPVEVLEVPAVFTLRHSEFRVLVAFCAAYDGRNNGSLAVTIDRAAELGISRNGLRRAQKKLEARRLLIRTRTGSRIPPRPHLYALSWLPIDPGDHGLPPTSVPSNAYLDWPKCLFGDSDQEI